MATATAKLDAGRALYIALNNTLLDSFAPGAESFASRLARVEASALTGTASDQATSAFTGSEEQLVSLALPALNPEMGLSERLFWILIFSLMVLIAVGGNTVVVYIVSTNKEMKSVTNYFLVNLSLADTMVSTLNVIFNFISMLNSNWPFGKIYCKISNFIAILSISASVFTLTAISCDRYNAIIHPLRPRMSHSHAIGWILLIWTLSSALAMPNAIFSTVVEDYLDNNHLAVTCAMNWPDGRFPDSSYDHIYNIVILVVAYLVPILTMAILYYKVGKELWGYEAIGENIEKQQRAIMAKKKIVKMMIVVVIIFALCWLPYHAFFVVTYYVPNIFSNVPLLNQRCYLTMYWLAMSNSMYNPIIIYFMNSKFRHEFRRILCFLCCCRIYTPPVRSLASGGNGAGHAAAGNQTNNNNNGNHHSAHQLHHHHHHHHHHAHVKRQTTTTSSVQPQQQNRGPALADRVRQDSPHLPASAQAIDNVQHAVVQFAHVAAAATSAAAREARQSRNGNSSAATTSNGDGQRAILRRISADPGRNGDGDEEGGGKESDPFICDHREATAADGGVGAVESATQVNDLKQQASSEKKLIDFANGGSTKRATATNNGGAAKVWI